MRAYLNARATRDWAKACLYLATKPLTELRRFSQDKDCANGMASSSPHSTAVLTKEAQMDVFSLRHGRKYSFLIYRRPDGFYAMPLVREADEWRLLLSTSTPVG